MANLATEVLAQKNANMHSLIIKRNLGSTYVILCFNPT